MKKLLTLTFALALMVCLFAFTGSPVSADYSEGDYEYTVFNGKATITKYVGSGGDVTIPSTLDGYPVAVVGDSAFETNQSITSVVIPDSITTISDGAFFGCNSLTSIVIPEGVNEINMAAFADCDSLVTATIESGDMSWMVFQDCDSLTNVHIGKGVKTIGFQAFLGCDSLKTVTMDEGVATIGDSTFYGCSNLITVNIPESVTTIGDSTFYGCSNLITVNIPESVTTIGDSAFYGCSNLTHITIGNNVKKIGSTAFSGCCSLQYNVYYGLNYLGNESNPYLVLMGSSMKDIEECTVHYRTKFAGFCAFYDCTELRKIIFTGDAPTFSGNMYPNMIVLNYPANNATWTDNKKAESNWAVFWKPYEPTKFEIAAQSEIVYAASDSTAKVTVSATGDGLTYQWYIKNAGSSKFSKSSITSATYSTTMSDNANGRQIYCVITDQYGNSVTTDTVTLTMKTELKITTQPKDVCVANGEIATVKVTAVGEGLTYKWYYKDAGASSYKLTTTFKGNTYTTTMTDARAGRRVLCKVYDKYGNMVKTNSVMLTQPVRITKQPANACVEYGETVTVKVVAKGEGLTYKWYFKDAGASSYKLTTSFTGNTYSITMTDARAGRRVLCKVYDKYGNMVKSSSALLSQAVRITKQPVSVTVSEGSTAKVAVKAVGDGLTYKWYFKDAGASEYKYTSSFKTNTYSITMTDARAGRRVLCIVYDKYGNKVQSNSVTLKMK